MTGRNFLCLRGDSTTHWVILAQTVHGFSESGRYCQVAAQPSNDGVTDMCNPADRGLAQASGMKVAESHQLATGRTAANAAPTLE